MTTDQGAGGYAIAKCHACQSPVRFADSTIEHLDGTSLCDEEIKP